MYEEFSPIVSWCLLAWLLTSFISVPFMLGFLLNKIIKHWRNRKNG